MRKKLTIVLIIVVACFQFAWYSGKEKNIAAPLARKYVLQELQQLRSAMVNAGRIQILTQKKQYYTQARKHYKRIEFFVEYFSPLEAKLYINGPPLPKHNPDLGNKMLPPQGFQRVEEILFSDPVQTEDLQNELKLLPEQVNSLEKYYKDVALTDDILLDMCQFQLYRMAALGLNGYDATLTQNNIQETLWTLQGIEQVISFFKTYTQQNKDIYACYRQLQKEVVLGKTLLSENNNYSSFERLSFITKFINPLNRLLVNFHNLTGLTWNKNKRALNLQNGFLFGKESFNIQFFSIYYDDSLNLKEQAALGKMLFSDPILSGNDQYSCANCHNPSKAFTDGLPKSVSIDTALTIKRNAPSLLNAIYQKAFFYDGRAYQMEQQVFDVIHSAAEMKSSLAGVVKKLKQNERYQQLFAKAFANTIHKDISEYAVQKVLAEYEKTLISFNSRFDQYLHGNLNSLNEREINGYDIFSGKALCGSCHFFPLFNGTVPPYFTDSEYEVIGTPSNANNKTIDNDEGRSAVTGLKEHQFSFKTPTVRNAAVTAPYMHNGVYSKLEEVVEFYHRGGGKGLGFDLPNQTLPFDSLKLTVKDKEDIVLFLNALTDTVSWKSSLTF